MPDRWRQIEDLYHRALELPEGQRSAFLADVCANDGELRQEVESLLRHENEAEPLMETPALQLAAQSLAKERRLIEGQQLGFYKILALIGVGGMGEVYRARDLKLKRDVAIKVLPDEFASHPERVTRFRREAELLASLNHTNIAAIYGMESGAPNFLVLELVEGQTLAERIRRGPIPLDDALKIAKQILGALEAAHDKHVVHRDLKPSNVIITPNGQVKVLDFGLAKSVLSKAANSELSNSPTAGVSVSGILLGTAAYMSPEQARGRAVDHRTDIFAFGCVLYEMLTGVPVFAGEDVSEILSCVLQREPDWTRLPSVPERIREVLELCLQKDPGKRRQAAGDLRIDLERASLQSNVASVPPARNVQVAWLVAGLALVLAAVLIVIRFREKPISPPERRLQINIPVTSAPNEFALSPDGRYIAFIASADGPQRLWLRALDETEARPLAGTDGADFPFWSPDSRSIGFFAAAQLYRTEISGGLPKVLGNAANGRGGAWSSGGTILFAQTVRGPLLSVPSTGGKIASLPWLQKFRFPRFPHFFPDGRHFLFSDLSPSRIYVSSLDGQEAKPITTSGPGTFNPPDRLFFLKQGALVTQTFDLFRGELTGEPITVADPVAFDRVSNTPGFSVSTDGLIAFRPAVPVLRQLVWFDRTGKKLGVAGDPDSGEPLAPELSPDGRHLLMFRSENNKPSVWLRDLQEGNFTRLLFNAGTDGYPIWLPDGTRIAYHGAGGIDVNLLNGAAKPEQVVVKSRNSIIPLDWSKDGRYLLYYENFPQQATDLLARDVTAEDGKPIVVGNSPFEESLAQFSPDGRWVAYQTNESGPFEIVVQAFPQARYKRQVSTGGGTQPRWRADGKELYFVAPDGKMMAVPIVAQTERFEAGPPKVLFSSNIVSGGPAQNKHQYAVARDGRFLINERAEESKMSPITVILNWKPASAR